MSDQPSKPLDTLDKIGASVASDQESVPPQLRGCGDFDIRIARDGTWYYRGGPIGRKALVKLFSTVIRKDGNGEYWLVTPAERGRIEVEDAPFTAVEMVVTGIGRRQALRFRTNVDDWIDAGPEHPIRVAEHPATGEPSPYITVRSNLEALILRPVFYRMVDLAVRRRVEGGEVMGLWTKNAFFPLGPLP